MPTLTFFEGWDSTFRGWPTFSFRRSEPTRLRQRERGGAIEFNALVRIDTPQEALYYANGGIRQYALRQLLAAKPGAQTVGV